MRHAPELSHARWRKSSYSNTNGGSCVEITEDFPGVVPVRDSKTPETPPIMFQTTAWNTFTSRL
ncbi:DUF397 domain-containing protein [Streptomyces sp. NPDC095613]|uniref:DUF397 domain-containing protein n=1 Tax=Streptomyces sp. NPDC095613 TaxID=3155540 RepID=UPI003319580F